MTVAECLKKWLKGFRAYDLTDVLTDIIDLDDGTFSIAKKPEQHSIEGISGRIFPGI